MKLVIDIPDKMYETVQNDTYCGTLYEELKNGIPLSESEDCVSRQAVLNLAKFDGRDGLGSIIHAFDVEQLPPVTAEKVGHWIDHQEDRWIYAKCSECETVHDSRTNYCPNCGSYNGSLNYIPHTEPVPINSKRVVDFEKGVVRYASAKESEE